MIIRRRTYWTEAWCVPYTGRQRALRGAATILALLLLALAVLGPIAAVVW